MTNRNRRILAVLAALLVAVVVIVSLRGSQEAAPPAPTQGSVGSPPALTPVALTVGQRPALRRAPSELAAAQLREQYEHYKAGSVYPDWSYPLTPDQKFLLEWNAPVTHDLPVDDDQKVFFRFDAEKGRVFAGEPYVSWAEAWTLEDGQRKNLPVRFEMASVVITSGPAQGDAFDLVYRDDGADGDPIAGDLRYTNRFVPSEQGELQQASSARIEAYVEVGGQRRRFLRDFVWAPRPVLEVVAIRDGIDDGSLVATLDCEVFEDGLYTFYGNLFAADGTTPIATSKRTYPLEAGRRKVKLVFFGKVINDQEVDGPYVLKDVHGLRRMGDDEYNNVWWQHAGAHRTRSYASTDFSGDEWDDPEKRERLATFERVIAEAERAEGGTPRTP
jgi:hypothetical protein